MRKDRGSGQMFCFATSSWQSSLLSTLTVSYILMCISSWMFCCCLKLNVSEIKLLIYHKASFSSFFFPANDIITRHETWVIFDSLLDFTPTLYQSPSLGDSFLKNVSNLWNSSNTQEGAGNKHLFKNHSDMINLNVLAFGLRVFLFFLRNFLVSLRCNRHISL